MWKYDISCRKFSIDIAVSSRKFNIGTILCGNMIFHVESLDIEISFKKFSLAIVISSRTQKV